MLTIGAGAVGRLRAVAAGSRAARHPVPFPPAEHRAAGPGLHAFAGVPATCQLAPKAAARSRSRAPIPPHGPDRVQLLATEADRRVLLDGMKLVRRIGASRSSRTSRAIPAGAGRAKSDDDDDGYARSPDHGVPPVRHLQDGHRPEGRGRPRLGARPRRPARRRRLHHADADLRQHQRADHHDRREGRRHDPRRRPPTAARAGAATDLRVGQQRGKRRPDSPPLDGAGLGVG